MKKITYKNIYASILPILGGLLGAIGGSGNKGARRILIPLLIMGLAYLETESILVITIGSMIGALSLGYGIPDSILFPGNGDKGSFLGRFYYRLFRGNRLWTNIMTRGTIGLVIGLSLISIPIIKKNWLIYFVGLVSIILVQSFLSWRNFGSYHLFKKELSWVETINWGLITFFMVLIIKLGG